MALCRSLDGVLRIARIRPQLVGNHLQHVGMSAAGRQRCGQSDSVLRKTVRHEDMVMVTTPLVPYSHDCYDSFVMIC
jgi:hypothetical protein